VGFTEDDFPHPLKTKVKPANNNKAKIIFFFMNLSPFFFILKERESYKICARNINSLIIII
jgi:hypothetical protein